MVTPTLYDVFTKLKLPINPSLQYAYVNHDGLLVIKEGLSSDELQNILKSFYTYRIKLQYYYNKKVFIKGVGNYV